MNRVRLIVTEAEREDGVTTQWVLQELAVTLGAQIITAAVT